MITALSILAEETDPDLSAVIDGAGPITGLFVLLLVVALVFIFRSMARQMRKISPELPEGRDDRQQAEDARAQREAVERGEREDDEPAK